MKVYDHLPFTPYEITRNCAVFIDDVEYIVVDSNESGHSFVREHDRHGTPQVFSHAKFQHLMNQKRAWVDSKSRAPHMQELHTSRGNKPIDLLGDRQSARSEYLYAMIEEFEKAQTLNGQEGHVKVTTGKPSLEHWLPIFHATVKLKASVNLYTHLNANKVRMPEPRTFLTILNTFKKFERHPLSLTTDHHGPGKRVTEDCEESIKIWVEHVNSFAADKKPEVSVVYKSIAAHIETLNAKREERAHLKKPSETLVRTMVRALDSYFILAGRESPEFARRELKLSASGIKTDRAGYRVEMDEWETDLLTVLEATRYFDKFPRRDRRRAKKTRIWVTAIIDTATRYVLALQFSLAPSGRTALDAIEMMMMDKTELGRTLGCKTPWHGACGALYFVTDQGSAFTKWEVTSALAGIDCVNVKPAAAEPEKRGFIEALFKALKTFLRYLDGQTFASIWERNEYDPAAKASVTIDFLNKYLVRAVVDVYHNQDHANLLKESPHVRWTRMTTKKRAVPVPPHHTRRIHFGLKDTRIANENGILVLGIRYHSPALGDLVMARGQISRGDVGRRLDVYIRIDKWCMSEISYLNPINEKWETACSTCGLPVGISSHELIETARKMIRENRAANAHNAQARWEAINASRESGLAAAARAELGDQKMTIEYLRAQEHKNRKVFQHTLEEQSKIDLSAIAIPRDVLSIDAYDRSSMKYDELKEPDEGEVLGPRRGNADEPVPSPLPAPNGGVSQPKKYQLRFHNEDE